MRWSWIDIITHVEKGKSLVAIKNVFVWLAGQFGASLQEYVTRDLRDAVFRHMQRLSLRYFQRTKAGRGRIGHRRRRDGWVGREDDPEVAPPGPARLVVGPVPACQAS